MIACLWERSFIPTEFGVQDDTVFAPSAIIKGKMLKQVHSPFTLGQVSETLGAFREGKRLEDAALK